MTQIGVYGWGVVAPRSPDIESFARNLESSESWLTPFNGFGPDNFLVGTPEFDFEVYRDWIDERFPANRFSQLTSKMDLTTLYAVGAFIQAIQAREGLESLLQELGDQAHVYIGTGLGAIPLQSDAAIELAEAQREWNKFWSQPERNEALARHLSGEADAGAAGSRGQANGGEPSTVDGTGDGADAPDDLPPNPESLADEDERYRARTAWFAYWAPRSSELRRFLTELEAIEGVSVGGGDVESSKIKVIRDRERRKARLLEEWGVPAPPWTRVTTNLLWNIPNTPASQVSMLGRITGLAFAPVAACSTFGVCLKLGMDAIRRGEAKAVVVGATDPPPHPLTVGAFYTGRVLAAGGGVSKPLTGLRGTHVAGGSAIWVIGERAFMESRGLTPLGMEPVSVGVSSDADHIITPSKEGPTDAIRRALGGAGVSPDEIESWDLHATATPGDFMEIDTLRGVLPPDVLVTARKGTFGHGMSAGGGWELTAQYLGAARGALYPTPLTADELNPEIGQVHGRFVYERECPVGGRPMGKLSMGVGGVNACVVSRPLEGAGTDPE